MPEHVGEKTEQATPRRLEEAVKHGQFARSAEVQTAFILLGGLMAFKVAGVDTWRRLLEAQTAILSHLHDTPVSIDALPGYAVTGAQILAGCVGPLVLTTLMAGLLAGGIQNRFQTASEALTADWTRLNPVQGLQRIFSARSLAPVGIGALKLALILGVSYSEIRSVLSDATIFSAASAPAITGFIADAALGITWRVVLSLALLAVLDYVYQFWRTQRDLMMTREEVKEELKNSEGDPHVKARQRRRRTKTLRQMLVDVPKADVVVTNPTHLAVALRYDRKTMKAPRIVAKGSRLNALRIREIAVRHQVPLVENKPLARLMFKHGRVGGEIPAQLYLAVAEVLAYVYRVNRYRYYAQDTQSAGPEPATANQV